MSLASAALALSRNGSFSRTVSVRICMRPFTNDVNKEESAGDILSSIAKLRMIDHSHVNLLHQLNSLLLLAPEVAALPAWEMPGVIPRLIELQECGLVDLERQARLALSLLGHAPDYCGRGLRILSIDGGGTRGLIPITVLKHIEDQCNQPIYKLFDFVCGTSTGSILAALLCLERVSARECREYYYNFSREVFKMNNLLGISQFFLNHAFYDARLLQKVLRKFRSNDTVLHDTSLQKEVPRMCFVSTVANQPTVEPFLFCNYHHHPKNQLAASQYQRTCTVQCWEAIMASTAAPGFFEEVQLGNKLFLDGGILTNNPCGVAVHEARLLWGKATPIQCIVSLGTGLYKNREKQAVGNKITSTSLKEKIIKVVAGATDTETVHTILKDIYDPSVYFRFQPELSEDISIDESKPEKLSLLCSDAEQYISSHRDQLSSVVTSLTAEKGHKQKIQLWCNSRWKKMYSIVHPLFHHN